MAPLQRRAIQKWVITNRIQPEVILSKTTPCTSTISFLFWIIPEKVSYRAIQLKIMTLFSKCSDRKLNYLNTKNVL